LECLQEDFVKTFLQTTFWVATDQFWHKYCLKFCNMQKNGLQIIYKQKWTGEHENKMIWWVTIGVHAGWFFLKKNLCKNILIRVNFWKNLPVCKPALEMGKYIGHDMCTFNQKYVAGLNTTQLWNLWLIMGRSLVSMSLMTILREVA
jgi:hypothetical protein